MTNGSSIEISINRSNHHMFAFILHMMLTHRLSLLYWFPKDRKVQILPKIFWSIITHCTAYTSIHFLEQCFECILTSTVFAQNFPLKLNWMERCWMIWTFTLYSTHFTSDVHSCLLFYLSIWKTYYCLLEFFSLVKWCCTKRSTVFKRMIGSMTWTQFFDGTW